MDVAVSPVQAEPLAMVRAVPLSELVRPLVSAQVGLKTAEADLVLDKARRKSNFWSWLGDFFCVTAAERKVATARAELQRLQAAHRSRVCLWLEERVDALSMDHAVQGAELAILRARQADYNQRYRALGAVVEKGRSALDMLEAAREACSSASTAEFFDMASKSKAVSAWSSMETSDASAALKRAQEAVEAFRVLFPAAGEAPVGRIDDTLDLVLDFAFELPFDFTSWCNMSNLDEAAANCGSAIERIAEVLAPLQNQYTDLGGLRTANARQIEALLVPFRKEAIAELPTLLREFAPKV